MDLNFNVENLPEFSRNQIEEIERSLQIDDGTLICVVFINIFTSFYFSQRI